MTEDKWGFHKAVFFLNADPSWRVRLCKCGTHYVADHPRRKYCGSNCRVYLGVIAKREHSPARITEEGN
jgi:hypothetical protein